MLKLHHKSIEATIDPKGAWLTELTRDGLPLLYPRTELLSESGDRKKRGGMHVCLPNFGPGGTSMLPQHGFGRELEWSVVRAHASKIELKLVGGTPIYAGLESHLEYEITRDSLIATLTTINTGAISFRMAPAFHPYFQLDDVETAVEVNGQIYELDKLAGTEMILADSVKLRTQNVTFSLSQTELPTWALWTDQLASYVCCEPTYGGYRFLEAPQQDEEQAPHEKRSYRFVIHWE